MNPMNSLYFAAPRLVCYARKDLRNAHIYIRDGLTGTAAIDNGSGYMAGAASIQVDTVVTNTDANEGDDENRIPVGARLIITGDTSLSIYEVTASSANLTNKIFNVVVDATSGNFTLTFNGQTTANIAYNANTTTVQNALIALSNVAPGDVAVTGTASNYDIEIKGVYAGLNSPTLTASDVDLAGGGDSVTSTVDQAGGVETGEWTLGISPTIGEAVADDAVVNILPQMTEVKVGSGNVTYSEKRNMEYEKDRGVLDTVRQGEDEPVDAKLEFVYEFVRASSGDPVTAVEAIKGINGASTYITSAVDDTCAPFAVDLLIFDDVPCGDQEDEVVVLKHFRWEGLDYDYQAASISVSGKCNVTDTDTFRGTLYEYEQSLLS